MSMRLDWKYLVLALAIAVVAAYFDLPKALGAHPWWSRQVVMVGAGVGLIVVFGASLLHHKWVLLWGAVITLVASAAAATYGKAQFAASYAEDAFAGQLWFFGWIGICFGAVTSISLFRAARRP